MYSNMFSRFEQPVMWSNSSQHCWNFRLPSCRIASSRLWPDPQSLQFFSITTITFLLAWRSPLPHLWTSLFVDWSFFLVGLSNLWCLDVVDPTNPRMACWGAWDLLFSNILKDIECQQFTLSLLLYISRVQFFKPNLQWISCATSLLLCQGILWCHIVM